MSPVLYSWEQTQHALHCYLRLNSQQQQCYGVGSGVSIRMTCSEYCVTNFWLALACKKAGRDLDAMYAE